jgi:hypothetical protein
MEDGGLLYKEAYYKGVIQDNDESKIRLIDNDKNIFYVSAIDKSALKIKNKFKPLFGREVYFICDTDSRNGEKRAENISLEKPYKILYEPIPIHGGMIIAQNKQFVFTRFGYNHAKNKHLYIMWLGGLIEKYEQSWTAKEVLSLYKKGKGEKISKEDLVSLLQKRHIVPYNKKKDFR